MRLHLIAVGRAKKGVEKDLFDHYAQRIRPALQLKEVEERKRLSGDELKKREAELILEALPAGAWIVALDERGQNIGSLDFSKKYQTWQDQGVGDLAFVIGGADGLDESVRSQARFLLSFGKLTWPHMLVRGMLAEQIFRAQAILSGHPYHRE